MRRLPEETVPALLLSARDAACALSVCAKTLYSLTCPRGPIPVVRIGRAVRYDRRDLLDWIERQKLAPSPIDGGQESEGSRQ